AGRTDGDAREGRGRWRRRGPGRAGCRPALSRGDGRRGTGVSPGPGAGAIRVGGSARAGRAGHVEGARPARGRDRWRGRSPGRVGSGTGPSRGPDGGTGVSPGPRRERFVSGAPSGLGGRGAWRGPGPRGDVTDGGGGALSGSGAAPDRRAAPDGGARGR